MKPSTMNAKPVRRPMRAAFASSMMRGGLLVAMTLGGLQAAAQGKHEHGAVRLDVALEATRLTVELEAPLDSLLGFEHRPRTDAQRKAATALLARMKDANAVVRLPAAAQCSLVRSSVESEALAATPAPAAGANANAQANAGSKAKAGEDEHADLDATYEFNCLQPTMLRALEITLFASFKRVERVEARVAGDQGQSGRVLTRSNPSLPLAR